MSHSEKNIDIQFLISEYILNIEKEISRVDISANYQEINKIGRQLIEHIKEFEDGFDLSLLTEKQIKSVKFFKILPKLSLNLSNNNIKEDHHIYIKGIEEYSLLLMTEYLEDIKLRKNKNYELDSIRVKLQDSLDVLKVSYHLNNNDLLEALDATRVDTFVREGFSEDFWNDWVLQQDEELLKKQKKIRMNKEKLEKELPKKTNMPSKKIKV